MTTPDLSRSHREDTVDGVRSKTFSRRWFLRTTTASAAGVAAVGLAACGGNAGPPPQLVALFSPSRVIVAGRPQRLPFGLVADGRPATDDGAIAAVRVLFNGNVIDEVELAGRLVEHDHAPGVEDEVHEHADILRYYALRTTLPEPGIYDLEVEIGDVVVTMPVQAFDQSEISVLLPGDSFPPLVTPTNDNANGVDPICSRQPEPCPFHATTVADNLATGQPMAVLVSTPALCATAYCGPVLETLIDNVADFPTVLASHIEVYSNGAEVNFNLLDPNLTPATSMAELGLDFEPALFLIDSDGIVSQRIDNLFDADELRMALQTIA